MIFFSTQFTVRAVAIVLVLYRMWPQFNYSWQDGTYTTFTIGLWSVQFILYTIVPIGYLLIVHHLNFKNKEEDFNLRMSRETDSLI